MLCCKHVSQENAEELAKQFLLAAKAVQVSFYVDDGLTGANDASTAICAKIFRVYFFCDIVCQHHLYLCLNKVNIPGFNDTMLGMSYITVSKYSEMSCFTLVFSVLQP